MKCTYWHEKLKQGYNTIKGRSEVIASGCSSLKPEEKCFSIDLTLNQYAF